MKRFTFLLIIAMVSYLIACEQRANSPVAEIDYETDTYWETTFEEVDDITDIGLDQVLDDGSGRRGKALPACVELTHDSVARIIRMDFGTDGCEGLQGHSRKGVIEISYSGRRFRPGSYRVLRFLDYWVDNVQVFGTRTLTNTSSSLQENPVFTIKMEEGRLLFPDGTEATRESDRTRTWFRASNPLLDSIAISGFAEGLTRKSRTYSVEITKPIIFKRDCQDAIPVAGEKVYMVDGTPTIINYGQGVCDRLVSITRNGETIQRELKTRPDQN